MIVITKRQDDDKSKPISLAEKSAVGFLQWPRKMPLAVIE